MKRLMLLSIISVIFALSTTVIQAQYLEKINISAFSSWENNAIHNSNYYGMYANYFLYKSGSFMFGPYITGSISDNSNVNGYNGNAKEIGAGVLLGWFSYSLLGSQDFDTWLSPNIGVKYNMDQGQVSLYSGKQTDWLLQVGLDLNIWQRDLLGLFPKIQINAGMQIPLSGEKTSFWDNTRIDDAVWDRGFASIMGKLTILNIGVGSLYLSPKLIGLYNFSRGDKQTTLGPGFELSLHKPHTDDFISAYCLYKFSSIDNDNRWTGGVMISFTAL
ncbi:hypothetical protein COT93_00875 [Candidatus Falkowbacteria bacterium CG10_big_fil_rev_8_21_14_0_10_37_18]|uniref:Outer membrane protein beta-barrel domain-containing protein n=1 Tax=Candidatus Falkowbacteria bacterium CG10_big_fil_rev_8_21_14_0_10_37_18 TaxID=1974562 RepID=A0A2H0V989_9BACT|nr:MAG: hypothetical protein COT93_00875 [Candidatus Falkowbacteria bacterium CG10_big_fil_rev_8_21_14_0_10_37_18]